MMSEGREGVTQHVTSPDGARIAYELSGQGPPLVVVGGMLCDRQRTRPLAEALSAFATVANVDRRGRGESGDAAPYAVGREIEDLGAVIAAIGGRAALYGHSSGAGLALRAAARGVPVTRLVLHEPPFSADDDQSMNEARTLARRVVATLAEGRHADAIEAFLTAAGVPAEQVEDMRRDHGMLAMAHTMRYDIEVMGEIDRGGVVPEELVRAVRVPTLVIAGAASPDFFRHAATRIVGLLQHGRYEILEGESHDAAPTVVARLVRAFMLG